MRIIFGVKRIHVLLAFFLILNILLSYFLIKETQKSNSLESRIDALESENFDLLDPYIAHMSMDTFLEKQDTLTLSYTKLRDNINSTIQSEAKGKFGFYMEDLTTGSWIGINERMKFVPVSLKKVPVVMGIMKKVESGELRMNQTFTLKKSDIDPKFGDLWEKGIGYNITLNELVDLTLKNSDNTAHNVLIRTISDEETLQAVIASGMPIPITSSDWNSYSATKYGASPKQYSNVFRGLYYSTYLKRPFSQYMLSEMINTSDNPRITAGSKVQTFESDPYFSSTYYHDCGIVYLPKKPYIICMMSSGINETDAEKIMGKISKIVFDYMEKYTE